MLVFRKNLCTYLMNDPSGKQTWNYVLGDTLALPKPYWQNKWFSRVNEHQMKILLCTKEIYFRSKFCLQPEGSIFSIFVFWKIPDNHWVKKVVICLLYKKFQDDRTHKSAGFFWGMVSNTIPTLNGFDDPSKHPSTYLGRDWLWCCIFVHFVIKTSLCWLQVDFNPLVSGVH